MPMSRGGLTTGRLMIAVAASAVICALLAVSGVPPGPGLVYGTVSCLAVVGIAFLARDNRDLVSALASVAAGILVGVPLDDPCTPGGIFVGPIVGFLARIASGPRFPDPRSGWKSAPVPDGGRPFEREPIGPGVAAGLDERSATSVKAGAPHAG